MHTSLPFQVKNVFDHSNNLQLQVSGYKRDWAQVETILRQSRKLQREDNLPGVVITFAALGPIVIVIPLGLAEVGVLDAPYDPLWLERIKAVV